jgi:hypothetical protein
VGDAPFATAQAARLQELRIAAVEDRVPADLALGRHRLLVAELGELAAAHPSRERLRGQLMQALYGSGRQSEALEAYEAARRELAESLGADPGNELASVHLAVLRGDPSLLPHVSRETSAEAGVPREPDAEGHVSRETSPPAQPAAAASAGSADARSGSDVTSAVTPAVVSALPAGPTVADSPSEATPLPVPHHELPAQLTSFAGREDELVRIGDQLTRSRLVTLTGPGGAGKTRLAVEAAARHPYDATFVDLAGITAGAELPRAVLGALGLRTGSSGSPAADPDPVAWAASALEGRPTLLVLDNCEHVVEDAARLAERLLTAAPQVRVLATSREALGIGGETLCPIPTLPLSGARYRRRPGPRLARAAAVRRAGRGRVTRLGIAVLGSVLSAFYRSDLTLPAGLGGDQAAAAREPVSGGVETGARLSGPAGQHLVDAAREAFTHSLHTTTLIAAAIMLLGAVAALRTLRNVLAELPEHLDAGYESGDGEREPGGREPIAAA